MIPRSLHQFWVGPPMAEAFVEFAAGWQRLHPDWGYRLWGDGDLPPLRNQDLYDRAHEIAPGFEGQLCSDIVRYELLYQFGGVWIDTDFECLKPIDDLLYGVVCFAAWEIPGKVAANGIMGADPGHPFIGRLIRGLPASVARNAGKRPARMSGPHYLTAHLSDDVTVYPSSLFYPYGCHELDRGKEQFPECYAVHHWANQRRLRRKPL